MHNTHTDLKPCPFCGGKAAFLDALYPPRVICTVCEVKGPEVFPKSVVDLWNTRARTPDEAVDRDCLREHTKGAYFGCN